MRLIGWIKICFIQQIFYWNQPNELKKTILFNQLKFGQPYNKPIIWLNKPIFDRIKQIFF